MDVHPTATAFVRNSSIKKNALVHKRGRYFLKLDFRDFFPSITFFDLKPILQSQIGRENREKNINIIRLVCFCKNDKLPIGYPTSPIISNIVMYEFDNIIISNLSNKEEYGITHYTRYADDLTFSTNLKGACHKIKGMVEQTLKEISSPSLSLNTKKTKFASSSGGSALITGLRICNDGHLTIHRKYKDKIRLLLSLYKKDKLSQEEILSLKGHLSYVRFVDGAFYTKMQNKYFKSIQKIIEISQ
jgi:retron-type reverse transcriptase